MLKGDPLKIVCFKKKILKRSQWIFFFKKKKKTILGLEGRGMQWPASLWLCIDKCECVKMCACAHVHMNLCIFELASVQSQPKWDRT